METERQQTNSDTQIGMEWTNQEAPLTRSISATRG